jgi:O-antigen ligase
MAALKSAQGATKLGLLILVIGVLLAGFAIGGDKLGDRMKDLNLDGRERMYEVGRLMAAEHPVFGSGPGTFNMLFQFYRTSPDEYWPAQLHNDWLETRITFGWVGSALIAAALLTVLGRRWLPGGIRCGWRFAALLWLALAGCLAHARYDFPLQVHSVLFLFLIVCAILFNLSRVAPGANGR